MHSVVNGIKKNITHTHKDAHIPKHISDEYHVSFCKEHCGGGGGRRGSLSVFHRARLSDGTPLQQNVKQSYET
jgi:hypothetical protein